MDTLAFWLPLFLLFFSALIGALIKRSSSDFCLKKFEGNKILIPLTTDEWITGKLGVFAQGIELIKDSDYLVSGYPVSSHILHSSEMDQIPFFIREAPCPDTPLGVKWKKERARLLNPPIQDRIRRFTLNSYNMLRDSFGQAMKAIVGSMSKDTRLGKTKDANKRLEEVQSNITGLVPNAWEPILEKYRGTPVAIERKVESGIVCECGILEDYSNRFLLLRDVKISDPILVGCLSQLEVDNSNAYDILYSRSNTLLRYSLK